MQYNTKKFAEITNETVKKDATAQLHQKQCEKSRHMQHHGVFVFARLLSFSFRIYVQNLKRNFLVENRYGREQKRSVTEV